METIDFWCPADGIWGHPVVQIKIPAVCCGTTTELYPLPQDQKGRSADSFSQCCKAHMKTYNEIWALGLEIKNGSESKPKQRCRYCR